MLEETGPARALPEYPWPAVALLDLPRLLGAQGGLQYSLSLVALFIAVDAAFAWCLWRAGGGRMTRGMIVWLLVAPVLGPLVVTRLDSLAGELAAVALLALSVSRPAGAGALLALGCGIKLFPALGLPALLLPGERRQRLIAIGGFAVTGIVLVAATLAAGGIERLWSPLAFQSQRGLQVEAFAALPFLWARHFSPGNWESRLGACRCYELHGPGVELALQLASAGLLIGFAGLAFLHLRAFKAPAAARTAALAARLSVLALIVFIATNKVFSPQYLIWLAAPLAVLALLAEDGLPRTDFALLMAACALTQVVFPLNYAALAQVEESRVWVLAVLLARDAAIVALGARLAARIWRDTLKPGPI